MNSQQKTRVFISCGQRPSEIKIAKDIENKLISLEFDTFLAIEQHTLKGLKENIFNNLNDSEYYVFIDFKREQLDTSKDFRGSLYTNQELAISSYLEKEVISFQEEGVKQLDGMISSLHLNPIKFKDTDIINLPDMIEKEIKNKKWNNQWKNKIQATINTNFIDHQKQNDDKGRHYHLKIENLHRDKTAFNCTAYINSIIDKTNNKDLTSEKVELKWAGSIIPSIAIMPKSYRLLDAFHVLHNFPDTINFSSYSDSIYHLPSIRAIAEYEITYLILSENFPAIEIITNIKITGNINTITFH